MSDEKKNYYGSDESETISYLEFGSVDVKKARKTIWAYWHDQQAYDLYMFSRYARDLLMFREFTKFSHEGGRTAADLNECVLNSAHDKLADYIFKYAGLVAATHFKNGGEVCESGSSLYGWIDEAIACDYVFQNGNNVETIKSMKYLGSDISDLMNKGAEALHHGISFRFSLAPTIAKLMDEAEGLSLFYGLGVSMRYALRDVADLLQIAKKSELAIFNRLSFAKGKDTIRASYGTGKSSYMVSLPRLIDLLNQNHIFVRYNTANMQSEKDGPDTVRVSMAMSKDPEKVKAFISINDDCVAKSADMPGIAKGEWKELCQLAK